MGLRCQLPGAAAAAAEVLSSTSALIGSPMIIKKKKRENTGGVQKELTIHFNPSLWIALGSSAAQV